MVADAGHCGLQGRDERRHPLHLGRLAGGAATDQGRGRQWRHRPAVSRARQDRGFPRRRRARGSHNTCGAHSEPGEDRSAGQGPGRGRRAERRGRAVLPLHLRADLQQRSGEEPAAHLEGAVRAARRMEGQDFLRRPALHRFGRRPLLHRDVLARVRRQYRPSRCELGPGLGQAEGIRSRQRQEARRVRAARTSRSSRPARS